jgi:hypothetical protein
VQVDSIAIREESTDIRTVAALDVDARGICATLTPHVAMRPIRMTVAARR